MNSLHPKRTLGQPPRNPSSTIFQSLCKISPLKKDWRSQEVFFKFKLSSVGCLELVEWNGGVEKWNGYWNNFNSGLCWDCRTGWSNLQTLRQSSLLNSLHCAQRARHHSIPEIPPFQSSDTQFHPSGSIPVVPRQAY